MPEYTFSDRLKHAWNAFTSRDPTPPIQPAVYGGFSYRPDRTYFPRGGERSVVASIITRIAIDCAAIDMKHVRLDEEGQYVEDIKSGLNNILTLEANIDQTSRAFKQDLIQTMLEDGHICAVPVETTLDPKVTKSYDITTMRVGSVVQWYPRHVRVNLYNDLNGKHEEVVLPKDMVAIVENPLYAVMNETNSTLQRLKRKLALLDVVDEQSSSGKLDLIIQLPYVVKSQTRKDQAETRRKEIEAQLTGSKYGIAYTDGTERITQLNRPVENNLLNQVEYLMNMVFGQLGITDEILKGTADEKTMLNYYNRTVEPILSAIALEFKRKFLTPTARTQGQSIEFYRNPFRLVPVSDMAEIADKFTRNEIMSSNEIRQVIGIKPSDDPKADELNNSNLYREDNGMPPVDMAYEEGEEEYENPGDVPISEIMN